MAAAENVLAVWIDGLYLGPNESVLIPLNIFDLCKRVMDPGHDNLGESMLFHFCVQSNVNPTGLTVDNNGPQQVSGRYLFRLCLKVALNNAFVEGTPAGGNTERQVQLLVDWHDDGFHYAGPVPAADSRP
ncbi:unnamed protein product, partial [Rotaria socialis]